MPTALSLIKQAYEENWEELDLSGMELTELPPEDDRMGIERAKSLYAYLKNNSGFT